MSTIDVTIIETPNLGDRSYVVALDGTAVVIDPQRDIDRVQAVLEAQGLTVTHVLETHIHNDYVSGGLVLAGQLGAEYIVPAGYALAYEATQLSDGASFTSGRMSWRVVHTPGHTPQHLSYAVAVDGVDEAVFTGGSMLFGSVGRPDLLGPDLTLGLAHDQWRSVRRLVDEVAGDAAVYPTHGFGSFCSVTATVGLESTVAQQRTTNPALTLSEQEFVDELVAGLDAYPAYYAHMGPSNQAGPGPVDLSLPGPADAAELRRRIDAGEWVVDLRARKLFARGHLRGTLSFDGEGNAITYLGWLIPWGTPVTLLGESEQQVQAFQRDLVQIGIDRPAAHATGSPTEWALDAERDVLAFPQTDFEGLAKAQADDPELLVLDTRRNLEWHDGHVRGARHLPIHELIGRIDEVVAWSRAAEHAGHDATVWVYCGSGFRAAAVCSLLERVGVPVVHVDDDWGNAALKGAAVVSEERPDETHRFGAAVTA
ncbi:MAG: rhodanese-like domain-containing protein [Actinomycetia bacterium]|nr:rhodanese-like domain-containing protein [Actinomycetes bacterium]